jgi:hypothetical protein
VKSCASGLLAHLLPIRRLRQMPIARQEKGAHGPRGLSQDAIWYYRPFYFLAYIIHQLLVPENY